MLVCTAIDKFSLMNLILLRQMYELSCNYALDNIFGTMLLNACKFIMYWCIDIYWYL